MRFPILKTNFTGCAPNTNAWKWVYQLTGAVTKR